MSAERSRVAADPDRTAVVPAELVDAMSDAVIMRYTDAAGRAAVISGLIEEIYAAVEWLNDRRYADDEIRSLQRVLEAVRDHHRRMDLLCATADEIA